MSLETLQALTSALADRYGIEAELGHGGMATVYLATDLRHKRKVAVKVLKEELAAAVGQQRFLREIEIAARLTHSHILPLHDSGQVDGWIYYVMPYVDGESLRDRLRREKQLSIEESARIACEVADALSYAHRHQVVHRDIKPENILIQDGRAMVADFGIARAINESATEPLTSSGIVLGTATYMSPEQGSGGSAIDARSDVYSLGCVLYEMLVGEPPYSGTTGLAILARHVGAAVPSVRVVRPDVPASIEQVVCKSLAKVPADRYPSAEAFRVAVKQALVPKRFVLPRRWIVLACALLLVSAAGVLARTWLGARFGRNDWLLVADFEGPSGDPELAKAVRELVTTDFEQSRSVRILPRRQLNEVMRLAGIAETTFVNVEVGRQLAQRSSVRGVMIGGVQPLGVGDYSIALHVMGTQEPGEIASVAGTAQAQTLVSEVQALSRQLRQRLGERRKDIEQNRPLRDVATPSFAAFRKYNSSLDLVVMHGDLPGANRLLAEAIVEDPAFAEAWAALGRNYLAARQLDSARVAFTRALARPERLSAAQRYRLQGDAAYALDHDLPAAVQWYDLYLAEVPHSRSGRSNRALYLSGLGRYEDALADLKQAVASNPFGPEIAQATLLNLTAVLVVLGRVTEARPVAQRLTPPFSLYTDILLATAGSDWPGAAQMSLAAVDSPSPPAFLRIQAQTSLASAHAARGAVTASDSVLRAAVASSRGATARWYDRARWLLAVLSGQVAFARSAVSDTTPAGQTLSALWAAASGDTAAAASTARRLQSMTAQERATVGFSPVLVQGWTAANAGRWREVVELLAQPALQGEHDPTFLDRVDSFGLRWTVATAYERLGQLDSAAIFLDLLLQPVRIPPAHYALRGLPYSFAHQRLAVLHDRLGHRDDALRHLDSFFATVTAPDSVMQPLVSEASRIRDRLRGARSAPVRTTTPRGQARNP